MVKQTPKRNKTLMEGTKRLLIEGYEDNTLWDLSGHDIAQARVKTLVIIAGMAMARESSSKAMEK